MASNIISDIFKLYGNSQYYQSIGELEGAAISYSSVSSIIYSIKSTKSVRNINDDFVEQYNFSEQEKENILNRIGFTGTEKTLSNILDWIFKQSLAQLDGLQEKIRSKSSKNNDDDEDEKYLDCLDIENIQFKGGSNCIFFKDLIGLKNEKKIIKSKFIQPLKYPNLYPALGKGILLYGFPGTGKTLLAKASVNELQIKDDSIKVLFFSATGAELKGKYVGETEKKIKKYFNCAHEHACECQEKIREENPSTKVISIIFIDEIDSIAGSRDDDPLRTSPVLSGPELLDKTPALIYRLDGP